VNIFFQGPAALITDEWYEAYRPHRQRIAIRDISSVFVVDKGRTAPAPLLVGSSSAAGLLAGAGSLGWPHGSPLWIGAALAVLVVASLTGRRGDRRPSHQLWAVHFGVHLLLLETTDPEELAEVRTAVTRAAAAAA
jgi:hypothetical protein